MCACREGCVRERNTSDTDPRGIHFIMEGRKDIMEGRKEIMEGRKGAVEGRKKTWNEGRKKGRTSWKEGHHERKDQCPTKMKEERKSTFVHADQNVQQDG
jgi:hypothetical protein